MHKHEGWSFTANNMQSHPTFQNAGMAALKDVHERIVLQHCSSFWLNQDCPADSLEFAESM